MKKNVQPDFPDMISSTENMVSPTADMMSSTTDKMTSAPDLISSVKSPNCRGPIYFCDICGKGFPYPSHLVIHKRTHSGIKPFACEYCDKRCTTKSNLKSHVLHNHF